MNDPALVPLERTNRANDPDGLPEPGLPEPWPYLRLGRRMLRSTEFARLRGVGYRTVLKWRKVGRLPQARKGRHAWGPVFIPEDATILDTDLAAAFPPGLALVLHWYRHAASAAERGHAITRALRLPRQPEDQRTTFFEIIMGVRPEELWQPREQRGQW